MKSVIEDLLSERGITISYEAIRLWCNKFGSHYGKRLKRKHHGYGKRLKRKHHGYGDT